MRLSRGGPHMPSLCPARSSTTASAPTFVACGVRCTTTGSATPGCAASRRPRQATSPNPCRDARCLWAQLNAIAHVELLRHEASRYRYVQRARLVVWIARGIHQVPRGGVSGQAHTRNDRTASIAIFCSSFVMSVKCTPASVERTTARPLELPGPPKTCSSP